MADNPFLEVLKRFEGYSAKPYWDYKQYTSGYGTRAASPGEIIDKQTAESRLQDEWYKASQVVDRVNPNLDPGTRAALTSLTYNAGPSWADQSLGQKIAAGDIEGAKPIFAAYNRAGGQTLPALVNRRQEELTWFGGNAPPGSAPVPPEQTAPRFAAGDSPALGTPPVAPPPAAAPTPSPTVAGASAGPAGLLGMLPAPIAGLLGIPQGAPQGIQAPAQMTQAYQPPTPAPLEMPAFDQLQFANQQPLRLARPQVKFGRGFY